MSCKLLGMFLSWFIVLLIPRFSLSISFFFPPHLLFSFFFFFFLLTQSSLCISLENMCVRWCGVRADYQKIYGSAAPGVKPKPQRISWLTEPVPQLWDPFRLEKERIYFQAIEQSSAEHSNAFQPLTVTGGTGCIANARFLCGRGHPCDLCSREQKVDVTWA